MNKRTSTSLLIGFICLLVNLPIIAQSSYALDEVIVKFSPTTTVAEIRAFEDAYNLDTIESETPVSQFTLYRVTFPVEGLPGQENPINTINGVILQMGSSSSAGGVGLPSAPIGIGLNYDLTDYKDQIKDSSSSTMQAPLASCGRNSLSISIPYGSRQVKASVFDTGIDRSHSNIFSSYVNWQNPGVNYVGTQAPHLVADRNGHGTHIASSIGQGVNPNNSVLNLDISKTHDKTGKGKAFDIIQAIDAAILKGTEIVNLSFTYLAPSSDKNDPKNPLRIAIEIADNILFVASAGNDSENNDSRTNQIAYPASFDLAHIISVASVGCSGSLSSFSRIGKTSVDIGAPGENVWGAHLNGKFKQLSGTSSAAAIVTGVATQLASHQAQFDNIAIKQAIMCGAVYDRTLRNKVKSNGYIDATRALSFLQAYCFAGRSSQVSTTNLEVKHIDSPSDIQLTINTEIESEGKIFIFDALGRILLQDKIKINPNNTIYTWQHALSNSPRLYFIDILANGQRKTLKVIR